MNKSQSKISVVSSGAHVSLIDGAKAYAKLRGDITKAGILDRDYLYYSLLAFFVFLGFFASLYFVIIAQSLISAAFFSFSLAFFAVQVAGLMHDCVHRAIFNSTGFNDFAGHIVSGVTGIAYNDWKGNHNRHHAKPNVIDEDPDLNLPLLSFSREIFIKKKGLAKRLSKYQAYLYFPMGVLVGFTIRLGNFVYFKNNFGFGILWQLAIYLGGLFAWFALPFFVFDFVKALVVFLVINSTAGVYLFNVFAPNHKGMPEIYKGSKFSFLEHQVITSRNIYPNPVTDFVYLGLNYQVEHHLFPECPRNKLKLITPYLVDICKKMNIPYTQVGIIDSNKMILNELKQISMSA